MRIIQETRRPIRDTRTRGIIDIFQENLFDSCSRNPAKGVTPFLSVFRRRLLFALLAVFTFLASSLSSIGGGILPAYSAEKSQIPAIGSGPYELYVFTDYFCGPCQDLEPEMDPILRRLMARKDVRIVFIDIPIHRQTVLFNRYFLYAARASTSGGDLLRIRKELFALAGYRTIPDEKKIANTFKKKNIAFKVFDLKPLYQELNRIIKEFNVRSTPTCVVKYSAADIRTYSGVSEIRNGLAALQATAIKK